MIHFHRIKKYTLLGMNFEIISGIMYTHYSHLLVVFAIDAAALKSLLQESSIII
jgi:hypothetical protein